MTHTEGPLEASLLIRVLGEYREMPGLALTFNQAQRLWGCDATTCRAVVELRALLREQEFTLAPFVVIVLRVVIDVQGEGHVVCISQSRFLDHEAHPVRHAGRQVDIRVEGVGEAGRVEPDIIQPFLGTDRLAEPLDRYGASVVFHGHAHSGAFHGTTPAGVPVYNVSLPVLQRDGIGRMYYVHELRLDTAEETAAQTANSTS